MVYEGNYDQTLDEYLLPNSCHAQDCRYEPHQKCT